MTPKNCRPGEEAAAQMTIASVKPILAETADMWTRVAIDVDPRGRFAVYAWIRTGGEPR